jgi:hypothetical protein
MSWAAVASAAIGVVGGIYSNKQAKKKSKTEKTLEQYQLNNLKQLQPQGQQWLQQGNKLMGDPLKFLQSLASGDRNTLMQTLGPELSALGAQNRAHLGQMTELAPRGGASSDFLSTLPFRNQAAQSNLMLSSRLGANQDLLSAGTNMANMGVNTLTGGSSGAQGLLNYGLARNNQAFNQGSATGAGLYGAASSIDWGKIAGGISDWYKKRQTGGTSANPYGQGSTTGGLGAEGMPT